MPLSSISRRLASAPRFFPTCYEEDAAKLAEEVGREEYDTSIHRFEDASIVFKDDGSDAFKSKTKAKTAAKGRK